MPEPDLVPDSRREWRLLPGRAAPALGDRVTRVVLVVAVALTALHVLLFLALRRVRAFVPDPFVGLSNMAHETGLQTWVSVAVYLVLGISCLLVVSGTSRRAWIATGSFFLALSADDACMLHERVGGVARPYFTGSSVYAWLFVLAPVLIACGGLVLRHFWNEFPARRERRRVVSAFACLGAALVLEAAAGPLSGAGWQWRGLPLAYYLIPVEELLELVGPTLLLGCVLDRVSRDWQLVSSVE